MGRILLDATTNATFAGNPSGFRAYLQGLIDTYDGLTIAFHAGNWVIDNSTSIQLRDGNKIECEGVVNLTQSGTSTNPIFEVTNKANVQIGNIENGINFNNTYLPYRVIGSSNFTSAGNRYINSTMLTGSVGPTFQTSTNLTFINEKLDNFQVVGYNFQPAGAGNTNVSMRNIEVSNVGAAATSIEFGFNFNGVKGRIDLDNCRVTNSKKASFYLVTCTGVNTIRGCVSSSSQTGFDIDDNTYKTTVTDCSVFDSDVFAFGISDTSNVRISNCLYENNIATAPAGGVRNAVRMNWSTQPSKEVDNNIISGIVVRDNTGTLTAKFFADGARADGNMIVNGAVSGSSLDLATSNYTERNIVENTVGINPIRHTRLGAVGTNITLDRTTGNSWDFSATANFTITLVNGKKVGETLEFRVFSTAIRTLTLAGSISVGTTNTSLNIVVNPAATANPQVNVFKYRWSGSSWFSI